MEPSLQIGFVSSAYSLSYINTCSTALFPHYTLSFLRVGLMVPQSTALMQKLFRPLNTEVSKVAVERAVGCPVHMGEAQETWSSAVWVWKGTNEIHYLFFKLCSSTSVQYHMR